MARCLVTGHEGYIGSHLYQKLQQLRNEVMEYAMKKRAEAEKTVTSSGMELNEFAEQLGKRLKQSLDEAQCYVGSNPVDGFTGQQGWGRVTAMLTLVEAKKEIKWEAWLTTCSIG